MQSNIKTVMVIRHSLAKQLLKEGYQIVDLLPKKNQDGSIDYTRSVYLFKYQSGIEETIDKLK